MSAPSHWIEGGRFFKAVASPNEARTLVSRTKAARNAGVPTPPARLERDQRAISFPKLDGESGVGLVTKRPMSNLLAPLLALNRASVESLSPFDPFAKILPRLEASDPSWLHQAIERLRPFPNTGSSVIHGDFHAGQLIHEASGSVSIIDLEDLALGSPEADLANFAAHLATRPETSSTSLADGLAGWLIAVHTGWSRLGQSANPDLLISHAGAALIRRALKLRERGTSDVLDQLAGLFEGDAIFGNSIAQRIPGNA